MIATSNAFKTAVKAQGRQTAMRVYVPTVSDNVELYGEGGSINRVARRKNYPDSDSVPLNDIALLDGSWQLGDKPITSMGATELGFISAKLSDDEGDFAANDRLTILMAAYNSELEEFGTDYFDFKGFVIEFKNDKGGHPTDFSVELMYHDYTRYNYSLTDYGSDHWEMDDLHEDVYRILITIKGWSLPNAHAVISRISFAGDIILTDDDIVKATLVENIGYDSTTGLPTLSNNTLEVEFDKQILDGFTPPKGVTLRTEIGVYTAGDKIEYVPCGEFKLDGYSQSEYDMVAKIKAFDKLYGWGEDTWYCPAHIPLEGTPEIVKQRYKDLLGDDIDIDDMLINTRYAYIPSGQSQLSALTELMTYTNSYVLVDKRGIKVSRLDLDADTLVDMAYDDGIYDVKRTSRYEIRSFALRASTASTAGMSISGIYEEIGDDRREGDFTFVFDEPINTGHTSVTDVALDDYTLDPSDYTLYLDAINTYAYDQQYLAIWYAPDTEMTRKYVYTGNYTNPQAPKGLRLEFETGWFWWEFMDFLNGEWVTVKEYAQFWADDLISMSNAIRYEYEVTWRGNPALELGDKVRFEDSKGVWRTGCVFANEYTYEGYLKCKTIIRSDT